MMKTLILTAAAVSAVFIVAASEPARAQSCEHVAGVIDASVVGSDPVTVLGNVKGDLAGATRAVVSGRSEGEAGAVRLSLSHDFVTHDRSVLTTEDSAVWTPAPGRPGVFHMVTEYEIVSGSGGFEGASGSLRNEGIADTNTGLLTLHYEGEICTD